MPTAFAFAVGTRRVILSFSKVMTNSSSFVPGDFLFFDAHDPADAMGRVDDMVVGLEFVLLVGVRGNLLRCRGRVRGCLGCCHFCPFRRPHTSRSTRHDSPADFTWPVITRSGDGGAIDAGR